MIVNECIRITPLSPTLVRLEEKGPKGFEDRTTFNVVCRDFGVASDLNATQEKNKNCTVITTDYYSIIVPDDAEGLQGISICNTKNEVVYKLKKDYLKHTQLPEPKEMPDVWLLADTPRVIPSPWGAVPVPENEQEHEFSGWDVTNDAADVYAFIPGSQGYEKLRDDFLKLTGPVPMPPINAFGLIYSRYYPYTHTDVLEILDTFREKKIPLDWFVIDTDWRVNVSHGYDVNTNLYPDMRGFMEKVHSKNVKVMFNDHPEPVNDNGLSHEELSYRQKSLGGVFDLGLDAWWYDRNWRVGLNPPLPGIRHDLWGMALYRDITAKHFPGKRPFVMSNTIGAQDGKVAALFAPNEHRFPIWWTGDTGSDWHNLHQAITNAVDLGIKSCLPYISEDLSGFYSQPSQELFIRYMQYGAFSPIMRLHGCPHVNRYPWIYGEKAEKIIGDFIRTRYRLLPLIYAAAYEAYQKGQPVLSRCDLIWPEDTEVTDNAQYMFGKDLLVAPVTEPAILSQEGLPQGLLTTDDGNKGLFAQYFDNVSFVGSPLFEEVTTEEEFRCGTFEKNLNEHTKRCASAVRWEGNLGPVEKTGNYTIVVRTNKPVKVHVDKHLVDFKIEKAQNNTIYFASLKLEEGRKYPIRIEAITHSHALQFHMSFAPTRDDTLANRTVFLPPGEWQELSSDNRVIGPAKLEIKAELNEIPIYMRCGGIVLTIPTMQYTNEKKWEKVFIDAYISSEDSEETRILYEDDQISESYIDNANAITEITNSRKNLVYQLKIATRKGQYEGQISFRDWVIRLHTKEGQSLSDIKVGDKILDKEMIEILEAVSQKEFSLFSETTQPPLKGMVYKITMNDCSLEEDIVISSKVRNDA